MAYYNQYDSAKKWLHVQFEITPDFGSLLFIGDEININALIININKEDYARYVIRHIYAYLNDEEIYSGSVYIPPDNPNEVYENMERIEIKTKLPSAFNKEMLGLLTFKAEFVSRGYYKDVSKNTVSDTQQSYNMAGRSYDASISSFNISRASEKNGEWIKDNRGNSVICDDFTIVVNGGSVIATDFEIKNIKLTSGEELIFDKEIDISVLEAAMNGGYKETSPVLFDGYEFLLSKDYRVDITLGKENEITLKKVAFLNRGYANMHLSGAKQGGVAFGGFSSSTDENPLFECFFPALFYQGFADATFKVFGNIIYPVGAIFICNGETDPNITFGGLWERLDGLYLRSSIGEVGKTGGDDTISKYITHRHVAPIGVRSGYMGAISLTDQSNGTEVFEAVNQKYATAKVDSTGKISGNIEFYYTDEYNGSISIPMNPKHLNVAMWERKELYNIETDPSVPKTAMAQVNMKRLEAAK